MHISLPLGMPFVSNLGEQTRHEANILRKAMIQFLFCALYWDLGCAYIEWPHGHGYTEYVCTIYLLGSQYIFSTV